MSNEEAILKIIRCINNEITMVETVLTKEERTLRAKGMATSLLYFGVSSDEVQEIFKHIDESKQYVKS